MAEAKIQEARHFLRLTRDIQAMQADPLAWAEAASSVRVRFVAIAFSILYLPCNITTSNKT
jgi:hypothetical protein